MKRLKKYNFFIYKDHGWWEILIEFVAYCFLNYGLPATGLFTGSNEVQAHHVFQILQPIGQFLSFIVAIRLLVVIYRQLGNSIDQLNFFNKKGNYIGLGTIIGALVVIGLLFVQLVVGKLPYTLNSPYLIILSLILISALSFITTGLAVCLFMEMLKSKRKK